MNVLFRAGCFLAAAVLAYALYVGLYEAYIPAGLWTYIVGAIALILVLKAASDWPSRYGRHKSVAERFTGDLRTR